LVDQGYSFKVVASLPYQDEALQFSTRDEQLELLAKVLAAGEKDVGQVIVDVEEEEVLTKRSEEGRYPVARRARGNISSLSGGDGLRYIEFGSGSSTVNPRPNNSVFDRPAVRLTNYSSLMDG